MGRRRWREERALVVRRPTNRFGVHRRRRGGEAFPFRGRLQSGERVDVDEAAEALLHLRTTKGRHEEHQQHTNTMHYLLAVKKKRSKITRIYDLRSPGVLF